MGKKPLIGGCNAFLQSDTVPPTQVSEPPDVEQLSRSTVRLRGVEQQFRPGMDLGLYHLRQLANREVLACHHIDMPSSAVTAHEEDARVGKVVHVEELALG